MAAALGYIITQLQSWTSPHSGELSDRLLLERFVKQRDEGAFAALVSRHGGMVLRSCRRILGDVHEAEDAVQATFLILARKAHTLRHPEGLPGWLHGVARRIALKARTKTATRAGYTQLSEGLPDQRSDPLTQLTARELLNMLDRELACLPCEQRSAVILCCLEGQTREQAARILGCTPGSLKGHLERGRRRLQERLARRGIALSAVLAVVVVSRGESASALFLQGCGAAALRGGIGSQAAELAHSVLRSVLLGKLIGIMTVVLTVALVAGTVTLIYRNAATEPPEDQTPAAAAPSKTPEKPTQEARVDCFGDPLPEGALLRFGSVRYRAGAGINHAAMSSNGKLLAAAGESGITIVDLATGKPRYLRETEVPNGFDSNRSLLAFSPDGKQLVSLTEGGSLRFWDVATGKRLRVVDNGGGPPPMPKGGARPPGAPQIVDDPRRFTKVWFPPKSQYVIATCVNQANSVVFVDPSTGTIQRRLKVAGDYLSSIAPDGKTLAIIDAQLSEVALYDDRGKELRRFHYDSVENLIATLCRGGKLLVTANAKAEIKVWDAATGKELRTIAGPATKSPSRTPTVLSITPDGRTLLVGTQRGDILRWDLRDGKELSPLVGHASFVTGLFLTPDEKSLVSVSWDNVIHRWDLTTGKAKSAGEGFVKYLRVARSPDGRRIAAASYPGRLEIWDARIGMRVRAFSLPTKEMISQLAYSPDGKLLALACPDARVRLWDVDNECVTSELRHPIGKAAGAGGESFFEGLAWSPDGRFLVTTMAGDGLRMWEAATGKEIWHATRGGAVAFSPDGKALASGGWDRPVTIQDAATGAVQFTQNEDKGVDRLLNGIAFSPDGTWLATCHHGGNVYLRDPKTGVVRMTLPAHRGVAWSISFSPDSKWLASSGGETVCVWEVATGTEVLRRKGHEGRAYQALFGPDGRTVLSSSLDLTALLWDLRPSSEPGRRRNPETLWSELAAEPAKAYGAIWELAADPRLASEILRKKLPPVKIDVDERRLRTLLSDLDSDDFVKRESASRALKTMGTVVEAPLRRTLANTKSAEAQRRLRGLLDELKHEPTAEEHRLSRAVQVMELCATAEALMALRDWAGGTARAPLTEQAKASLERMKGRAERGPQR